MNYLNILLFQPISIQENSSDSPMTAFDTNCQSVKTNFGYLDKDEGFDPKKGKHKQNADKTRWYQSDGEKPYESSRKARSGEPCQ